MDTQEVDRKEISILRGEALTYFGPNGLGKEVLEHMEDVANSLFYDNPEDINAYLIHARFIISGNGLPAFEIDIYCKVKNMIKHVSTLSSPNSYNFVADTDKALHNTEQSIMIINEVLSKKFFNCCPYDQLAFDDELKEIFYKLEVEYFDAKKTEKVIQQEEKDNEATSDTESITSKKTGVTKSKKNDPKQTTTMVIFIISGNFLDYFSMKRKKGNTGKKKSATNVDPVVKPKEKDTSFLETIMPGLTCKSAVSQSLCYASSFLQEAPLFKYLSDFYNIGITSPFTIPTPMISVTSSGLLSCIKEVLIIPSPNMPLHKEINTKVVGKESRGAAAQTGKVVAGEKLESTLDNIKEILTRAGYTPNEDFYLGLNCSAQDYFQENKEEWTKLCGELSSCTFIFGQDAFSVPSILIHETPDPSFSSSGIILKFDDSSTVTDLWKSAFKFKDYHQLICMSSSEEDSCSSFCVDMAVALRAMFIKIGVINKLEKSIKLQRLIQIHDDLDRQSIMNNAPGQFTFHQVGSIYKEQESLDHDSESEFKTEKKPHKKSPNRSNAKI
ncbi:hypothetical protein HELRODRAFT_161089 [Helobdella robusta]|uniref:phosphopyruvate hydratase n=1 Tax=Helobdella robusta TaxID=6412 RepID=T1ER33_HELRO|nr:hypothetical protein HELRODRAFT_161089 [Helobdella robusta]ESO01897.1 hypothetical protein HELRODRAFT_161089 [Helobdella robusta]